MSAQSHYLPVVAEERSEAAIGCVAVANPGNVFYLTHRVRWFYDCYAVDRSLAPLLSDYRELFDF